MEQQLLGELSPDKEKEIIQAPGFQAEITALEASNREILEKYPADLMLAKIIKKIEENDRAETQEEPSVIELNSRRAEGFMKFRKHIPLLAAAVLAVTILLPVTINNSAEVSPAPETGTRIKGLDPHLNIYRKTGEKVELLPDETPVNNFDLLQLSYISGGKKYGAIFSIDGNGFITLHYPDFSGTSPELDNEGEVPLNFSYQLDDAPGFERFFFVTSDSAFSVNTILSSAEKLTESEKLARNGELEVPPICETDSILLIKEGSDEK